jgi:outer membrane protein assembly factor BamB
VVRNIIASRANSKIKRGGLSEHLSQATNVDLWERQPATLAWPPTRWHGPSTSSCAEPVQGEPAIADLNGDNIPDIVIGTTSRKLHCISGKGDAELWSYEVGAPIRFCAPLIVKGAKDAESLIFIGTGPPENALYCLSGACPRPRNHAWLGPWKPLTTPR